MKANFDRCMSAVFSHEGGYVHDPNDPGGETNMGISKRSYPNEDIRNMTRVRAAQIYRRDFWNAVKGDDLPPGLDLVAFDAAVNSGPSRGAKWLQSSLGVTADGVIGPQTLKAAREAQPTAVIDRACDKRLGWLRTLSTWKHYGNGWTSRVEGVRDLAHEMSETPTEPDITTGAKSGGLIAALLSVLAKLLGRG